MNAELVVAVISASAGLLGVSLGAVLPLVVTKRNERDLERQAVRRTMRLLESELFRAQRQLEETVNEGQHSNETLTPIPTSWTAGKELLATALSAELFKLVSEACVEVEREHAATIRALAGQRLSDPLDQDAKARLLAVAALAQHARLELNRFQPP